ncbi:MAG TPA: ATP-binding cassette domain-containing protein [Microvirga sp.]|nr:ATP-binding cassette domain-containing protein [Microvirga sp.]
MMAPIIACRNLWKFYGATRDGDDSAAGLAALKDATFDIFPGECFVIMGLSGSGKSTLVRCITRLIEPSRGQVVIEGIDVTAASASELTDIRRRFMGMVFQHFALLPHLTVLDNVAFPLSIRGVGLDERRRRAGELLSLVGLSGREGHYPRELSGGQQQRVGIARALATDPPILFMDEPFSSLDPLLRRELQNEFAGLRERLRKTIVFITHDFDEAIRLADRIAIMRDGKILEIGTAEDLIIRSRHPYVREFTKHADRKNVIKARSLARPADPAKPPAITVDGGQLVSEIASEVMSAGSPVGVAEDGRLLGLIAPSDVLSILKGDEFRREGSH